jgi:hypothetical protein
VAAETRRRFLIAKKFPRHRGQPPDGEDGRNAERHLGDAAGAIAKEDWNLDHAQISPALDEDFKGDFKTSGRRR